MKEEQYQFLSLQRMPVHLTAEQVTWFLNCQTCDVPILVGARLLMPLGNPAANGIKFYSTAELLEAAKDKGRLIKVTNAVNQH